MVYGIFCNDDRMFGLYGHIFTFSREISKCINAVIAIYKIVFRGEGDNLCGVDGVRAEGQVVEILHLIGGIINLDILVVVVVIVIVFKAPLPHIAHPIVANVEHLFNNKVVDLGFSV